MHLLAVSGEATLDALQNIPDDVPLRRQTYVAKQIFTRGFTTVRGCRGAGLAVKEAPEEGIVFGPRLLISRHEISQTNGKQFPDIAMKLGSSELIC